MGNGEDKYIHHNITIDHLKDVLPTNKKNNLLMLFNLYSQRTGFLTKENFNKIIRLDDEKMLEKIFNIFCSEKDRMFEGDLLYFYTSFANENLKNILLSFLILEKKSSVDIKTYLKSIAYFISIDDNFKILNNSKVIKHISSEKTFGFTINFNESKFNKSEGPYIYKRLLIDFLSKYPDKNDSKLNFSFYHEIKKSSSLFVEGRNTENHYVCDCLKKDHPNDSNADKNDESLEKIKPLFLKDKLVVKDHLPLENLEKLMIEFRVNKNLIDLIINYLKSHTMKDSINFNDFKDLISHVYDLNDLTKKKDFLFKLMLAFYNKKTELKGSQIKKFFKIEDEICKLEDIYDQKKFQNLNDGFINAELSTYIEYMENLGYLPYVRYNLETENQVLKKKIINFILNKKSAEDYLKENFDKCNKFYPINKKFWDSLINNKIEGDNQPTNKLEVNNSLIADKDEIYYVTKKQEEKNQKQKTENKTNKDNKNINQSKQESKDNIEKNSDNKNEIKAENKNNEDNKNINQSKHDRKDNIEKNSINKNEIKTNNEKNEEKKEGLKGKGETKKEEKKIVKESIKEKNKKCIKGKLKNNVKYGEDYVIICGDIYEKIFEYYEFDKLVELDKTIIFFEPKKEEENKSEVEQKDNKIEAKEEEKIEIIDIQPEKLKIDLDNKCLRKKENKDKRIKEYIVDFYPVKILQVEFNEIFKTIKEIYEKLEKEKKEEEYKKMSKEEKSKFKKEQKKEEKIMKNIVNEFNEKVEEINDLLRKKIIDNKYAQEKYDSLKQIYKDLNMKDKELKITKKIFFDILGDELNNLLVKNGSLIKKLSKFITNQEIKYQLVNYTPNLNINSFDLIFYSYSKKHEVIKEDECLGKVNDEFVLMIFDTKNQEGKTGLSILEENEKSFGKKKDIKNIESLEDFEIASEEELKKMKEERELKEKEKKEKERLEKEKLEKEEKERRKAQEKLIKPPYGIPNFGNTCYFNSVNQIILNLPIMQKLFSDSNIKYMINKENKFGYKGKLVSYFMPLYELYPYQIEDYVKNLKSLVGKLKETFNNREQQDAHEYLNFILEGLHEELNLKSSKIYIEDNDDNFKFNTEEELGNIAWANNLRRNASFIDSIFMFQLRSNLTCKKCQTTKYNFESSYVFNLPLSLCKLVTVHISLFRLPFKYKVYYDKISDKFKEFKQREENKDKHITEILCDYYSKELTFEQKKDQTVKVTFEFDFEREKSIGDLIKLIRNISLLELERLEPEYIDINEVDSDIKEIKIKYYSELFAYSHDKNKIIKNDTIIDKYADVNDKVYLYIYEVLNTNGFSLINKQYINKPETNLVSFQIINKKSISKYDEFEVKNPKIEYFKKEKENKNEKKPENNEPKTQNKDNVKTSATTAIPENNSTVKEKQNEKIFNILSANDQISYINNFETDLKNKKFDLISEIIIPIVHYKRDLDDRWQTIFQQFYFSKITGLPLQLLILNNDTSSKLSSKYLYNYIWNYNSLYMTHPNKNTDKFWFNMDKDAKDYKKCYPFIIRIVKQNTKFPLPYKCSKCHWFNFCIGCVLSPDEENVKLEPDDIIFVDWCNELIKEEFDPQNFYFKNFSSEEITLGIESAVKNDKNNRYQSIQDCFDLFFEKENLEDPLSCRNCGGPQNFIKNYEINKLPYVLVLALKRFKYNENNNFKLRQLITYPINNYKLKDKIYNLFGVIYHYGGINSGHYTCAIRKDKKWILCDDSRITEIEEKRVMTSNAYILFYIANDSINTYSYYNCMKSLLQHMIMDKSRKIQNFKDNNFFKGEPVRVKSKGNGYVVEDYLEDFIIEKEIKKDSEDKKEKTENEIKINEEFKKDKKENEIKINEEIKNEEVKNEEIKNEEIKNEEIKNEEIKKDLNVKKDGLVKVKFESIKEVEIIDKNNIEKLILIDEQKKDN